MSAQAEVAADQEQLIIAETAVKQAEDRLRLLIFDPTQRDNWNVAIEPIDSPPVGDRRRSTSTPRSPRALRDRADLLRARKDIENAQTNVKFAEQPAAARRAR